MEDRPARVGDLRSLRRWLIVAAVWATAATAIAVIALIAARDAREDNSKAGRQSARTAGEISAAQRAFDRRLDTIERRLDGLASADDVSGLADRLERLEGADGDATDQLDELTTSVDDLETRVEDLEESAANSAAGDEAAP